MAQRESFVLGGEGGEGRELLSECVPYKYGKGWQYSAACSLLSIFADIFVVFSEVCQEISVGKLKLLVQHVVKSVVILVCVCDPLPASSRSLLDNPRPLRGDRQGQSADPVRHPEHCVEVRALVVAEMCFTGTSSRGKGDGHDLCELYTTGYGVRSRLHVCAAVTSW